MHLRGLWRGGHWPTLTCAFLYFDISFMVWVLLGALANSIVPDFGLDAAQRGFMVAVPILGGALLRLVLGVLTDSFGARRTGLLALMLTVVLGLSAESRSPGSTFRAVMTPGKGARIWV